jgi:hypothetical protein
MSRAAAASSASPRAAMRACTPSALLGGEAAGEVRAGGELPGRRGRGARGVGQQAVDEPLDEPWGARDEQLDEVLAGVAARGVEGEGEGGEGPVAGACGEAQGRGVGAWGGRQGCVEQALGGGDGVGPGEAEDGAVGPPGGGSARDDGAPGVHGRVLSRGP